MNIAVIGDSIVHGGIDKEAGGWVNRLKVLSMNKGMGDHVFNFGIGGNNSRQILERARTDIAPRVNHINSVIYSTGTNDMNGNISEAEFQENLERLGKIAEEFGKRVYFMGLFNRSVGDWKEITAMYNSVIEQICREHAYTFIPTIDVIVPDDLVDGCHPNAAGHQKLCDRVAGYLCSENE